MFATAIVIPPTTYMKPENKILLYKLLFQKKSITDKMAAFKKKLNFTKKYFSFLACQNWNN